MAEGVGRTGFAALLEALRAPLLLSPAADVYTGWVLVLSATRLWHQDSTWPERFLALPPGTLLSLLAAAAAGCLLLAAGMAQNALVDQEDDAARKPERPLPRGAVSPGALRITWILCAAGAVALLLPVTSGPLAAGAILGGSSLYHLVFKRRRGLGCVTLGLLRGCSMGLGVLAARTVVQDGGELPTDLGPAILGCVLYALYIFGASLHASTDDEPADGGTSAAGLTLSGLVLAAWAAVALARLAGGAGWYSALGGVILLWALVRLLSARFRLPPPAVTGVALSGLHLLHAGVAALMLGPAAAAVMLLLFGVSRALLRVYPPS